MTMSSSDWAIVADMDSREATRIYQLVSSDHEIEDDMDVPEWVRHNHTTMTEDELDAAWHLAIEQEINSRMRYREALARETRNALYLSRWNQFIFKYLMVGRFW